MADINSMRIPSAPLISERSLQQAGLSPATNVFRAEVVAVSNTETPGRYVVTVQAGQQQLELQSDQPFATGSKLVLTTSNSQPPTVSIVAVQPPGEQQALDKLLNQWLASRLPLTQNSRPTQILDALVQLTQQASTPADVKQVLQQFLQLRPAMPSRGHPAITPTAAQLPPTANGPTAVSPLQRPSITGPLPPLSSAVIQPTVNLKPGSAFILSSTTPQLQTQTVAPMSPNEVANSHSSNSQSISSTANPATGNSLSMRQAITDAGVFYEARLLSLLGGQHDKQSSQLTQTLWQRLSATMQTPNASSTASGSTHPGTSATPLSSTALVPGSANANTQVNVVPSPDSATQTPAAGAPASPTQPLISSLLSANRPVTNNTALGVTEAKPDNTSIGEKLSQLAQRINQQAQQALSQLQGTTDDTSADDPAPADQRLAALLTPSQLSAVDLKGSLARAYQLWHQLIHSSNSPKIDSSRPAPLPLSYTMNSDGPDGFRLLQSTLANLEVEQFQHLRSDQDGQQPMSLPLFLRQGEQLRAIEMELESANAADGLDGKTGWHIVLHFELQQLGPLDVEIELSQDTVSATFWSQQANTLQQLQQQLPPLRHTLEALGVEVDVLHARHGQKPAKEHNQIRTRLVDLHT